MGVEWQAIAAVATAIAAGVTALMTFYTRRLAGETVALAADSREQIQLSRQALAESWRSRLDAAAPVVTIGAGPATVYEPSGIDGGESNELHAGLAYSLPADQDRLVGIRAQFTIRNEGATTAGLPRGVGSTSIT